jgi:DedD protein
MDDRLKKRLVGAVVLVLAAVVFVPMILDQGGETPKPAPRIMPTETLEHSGVRVVPLDPTAIAPDPVPAEPTQPDKTQRAPTPAPPVEMPKEPAPATADTRFAVQMGSFAKAANASGLRDKLKAKGYEAFVKSVGATTRVYVGPQSTRAEAEKALQALRADTKIKGILVKFPS